MLNISIIPVWVWWIVGFIIGFGFELFIFSKRKDGTIHIYKEEETDRYLFEFNVFPEDIPKMKQVVFIPKIENDDSQNLHGT